MVSTTEELHLENHVGQAEALIQDVQRSLTRAALKGRLSASTKSHMELKLLDAAAHIKALPEES